MTTWTIWANYDPAAKVWYTCDSELPGLVAEGETLDELERKIAERFTDMLEGNAHLIEEKARLNGPHSVRLVAFSETHTQVAA
jgi:predicted RNase H-like HicB family nuclease